MGGSLFQTTALSEKASWLALSQLHSCVTSTIFCSPEMLLILFRYTWLRKIKPESVSDRKSTRLNSNHECASRMPSHAGKHQVQNSDKRAKDNTDNDKRMIA